MPDDKDDAEKTPVQTPEARRRSSASMKALVRCPKCRDDSRQDCDLCFNPTINSCTRYVPEGKAIEWSLQHADTDPPKEGA